MVYLIHFAKPFHHARHYIGFTRSAKTLAKRLEHHAAGRGARLMAAVSAAGIGFEVVRTWKDADRTAERKLKNRKHAPQLCPVCRKRHGRAA